MYICEACGTDISIHALREEGDFTKEVNCPDHPNFYPRPPRGRRRGYSSAASGVNRISIHALREEGDNIMLRAEQIWDISIHALREEGDSFQTATGCQVNHISIHALREEGDLRYDLAGVVPRPISIHALREEGDQQKLPRQERTSDISIHALREEGDVVMRTIAAWSMLFLSTPSARKATDRHSKCKSTTRFLSTPSARKATPA